MEVRTSLAAARAWRYAGLKTLVHEAGLTDVVTPGHTMPHSDEFEHWLISSCFVDPAGTLRRCYEAGVHPHSFGLPRGVGKFPARPTKRRGSAVGKALAFGILVDKWAGLASRTATESGDIAAMVSWSDPFNREEAIAALRGDPRPPLSLSNSGHGSESIPHKSPPQHPAPTLDNSRRRSSCRLDLSAPLRSA